MTLTETEGGTILMFESLLMMLLADDNGIKWQEPTPSPGNVLVAETSYKDNTNPEMFALYSDEVVHPHIE